jgi:hypothetical protein
MDPLAHLKLIMDVGYAAGRGVPNALSYAQALGALETQSHDWPSHLHAGAQRVLDDCRMRPAEAAKLCRAACTRLLGVVDAIADETRAETIAAAAYAACADAIEAAA